jgi:hypothetical protein
MTRAPRAWAHALRLGLFEAIQRRRRRQTVPGAHAYPGGGACTQLSRAHHNPSQIRIWIIEPAAFEAFASDACVDHAERAVLPRWRKQLQIVYASRL